MFGKAKVKYAIKALKGFVHNPSLRATALQVYHEGLPGLDKEDVVSWFNQNQHLCGDKQYAAKFLDELNQIAKEMK